MLAAGSLHSGFVAAGLTLVILGVVAVYVRNLAARCRATTFKMTAEGLLITAPIYTRVIPLGLLKLGEARVVKLPEHPELRPWLRTNGIGMPGIQIGWFRLRNREKALLYRIHSDTLLYVPTTAGYTLMMGSDTARAEDLRALLVPRKR